MTLTDEVAALKVRRDADRLKLMDSLVQASELADYRVLASRARADAETKVHEAADQISDIAKDQRYVLVGTGMALLFWRLRRPIALTMAHRLRPIFDQFLTQAVENAISRQRADGGGLQGRTLNRLWSVLCPRRDTVSPAWWGKVLDALSLLRPEISAPATITALAKAPTPFVWA